MLTTIDYSSPANLISLTMLSTPTLTGLHTTLTMEEWLHNLETVILHEQRCRCSIGNPNAVVLPQFLFKELLPP